MNYLLIFVVVSLIIVAAYFTTLQKKVVMRQFANRTPISPIEQLLPYFDNSRELNIAVDLWNELARTYGISPMLLRTEDKLRDIVSSDFFGDKGLELEEKLKQRGVFGPLESLSILEMALQYVAAGNGEIA